MSDIMPTFDVYQNTNIMTHDIINKTLQQAEMTREELLEATQDDHYYINGFIHYSDTTKFVSENYFEIALFFSEMEDDYGYDLSNYKTIDGKCITIKLDNISRVVLELVVSLLRRGEA